MTRKWVRQSINVYISVIIIYMLKLFDNVHSIEWDCVSSTNTGIFTRSINCTISGNNHVDVSNTLEITGSNIDMNNLIMITAATNQRHFSLNHANAKLILRYLKLVGGDVSSYAIDGGGSICIGSNGELNLYSSIVFNNKAGLGGGINAEGASNTNKNARIMNIYNSIIHNNEAAYYGGGIYIGNAVATIYNTTIDYNQASGQYSSDGGGMAIGYSDVTMKNTIISNNDASNGGGLVISGDSTTVTLRQSSFINNDATNNGDEIHTYQSPTISLINTYFNNPNNNNNIYECQASWCIGTPRWKTCSDNLCTESPFTGTCNAVNSGNAKLGVACPMQCTAGKFNDLDGKINEQSCKLCGTGKFNDLEGQSNCKNCGIGKFNDVEGQFDESIACKNCVTGKFNDLEGQSNCKNCVIGKFNDLEGQFDESIACKNCVTGKFNNLEGQSEESIACMNCPIKTYNDLTGQSICKSCPLTDVVGASKCCFEEVGKKGIYQIEDKCFTCPKPQHCLGGTTCTANRTGKACMRCIKNYYSPGGNDCIPCPESSIAQWIVALVIVFLCIFITFKVLKENFVEEDDDDDKNKSNINYDKRRASRRSSRRLSLENSVNNTMERPDAMGSVKRSVQKSSKQVKRVPSTSQMSIPILAKHMLILNITLPLIPFIYLPPEIRQLLQLILSIITFDISNFVSSPECEWDLATIYIYIIKICLPLAFVGLLCWYMIVSKLLYNCTGKNKFWILENQIIGVGTFLWVTSLYSLNIYQTLSAFDCTRNDGNSPSTLDMDPNINCYERNNSDHIWIVLISVLSLILYTCIPTILYIYKREKQMPKWEDPHMCPYYDEKPCFDCDYCDYRQRYGCKFLFIV